MLDNLKLGYGGTQSEALRLVNEASQMTDVMEELGVSVEADSLDFDNLVNAISVVQKNMGITGTTAEEASETIEGSISSAQAAWTNWITGLGNENADMVKLTNNLAKSIATAGKNLIPRIVQIIKTAGTSIATYGPEMAAQLWDSFIQALNEAGMQSPAELVGLLFQSISNILNTVASSFTSDDVYNVLDSIGTALTDGADENEAIIDSAVSIGSKIMSGIGEYLREHGSEVLTYLADGIWNTADTGFTSLWAALFKTTETGHTLKNGVFSEYTVDSEGNITYHAPGGIYNTPTALGRDVVGEAGKEAILPLNSQVLSQIGASIPGNEPIDYNKMAAAFAQAMQQASQSVDGRAAASALMNYINAAQGQSQRYSERWA